MVLDVYLDLTFVGYGQSLDPRGAVLVSHPGEDGVEAGVGCLGFEGLFLLPMASGSHLAMTGTSSRSGSLAALQTAKPQLCGQLPQWRLLLIPGTHQCAARNR